MGGVETVLTVSLPQRHDALCEIATIPDCDASNSGIYIPKSRSTNMSVIYAAANNQVCSNGNLGPIQNARIVTIVFDINTVEKTMAMSCIAGLINTPRKNIFHSTINDLCVYNSLGKRI